MKTFVNRFASDQSGATAIEYGLIAAIVSVALVTALTSLGGKVVGLFTKVSDSFPP